MHGLELKKHYETVLCELIQEYDKGDRSVVTEGRKVARIYIDLVEANRHSSEDFELLFSCNEIPDGQWPHFKRSLLDKFA